jgi:hypothetical protein
VLGADSNLPRLVGNAADFRFDENDQLVEVDNRIKGYGRLSGSCGTTGLKEAERLLVHRLEQIQLAEAYGVRPTRTFSVGAERKKPAMLVPIKAAACVNKPLSSGAQKNTIVRTLRYKTRVKLLV